MGCGCRWVDRMCEWNCRQPENIHIELRDPGLADEISRPHLPSCSSAVTRFGAMACLGRVLVLLLAVGMAQRTIAALPFLYADELVARSDAQVVGRVMFVSQQELPRPRVEGQTDTVTTALVNIRDSVRGTAYHRRCWLGSPISILLARDHAIIETSRRATTSAC